MTTIQIKTPKSSFKKLFLKRHKFNIHFQNISYFLPPKTKLIFSLTSSFTIWWSSDNHHCLRTSCPKYSAGAQHHHGKSPLQRYIHPYHFSASFHSWNKTINPKIANQSRNLENNLSDWPSAIVTLTIEGAWAANHNLFVQWKIRPRSGWEFATPCFYIYSIITFRDFQSLLKKPNVKSPILSI